MCYDATILHDPSPANEWYNMGYAPRHQSQKALQASNVAPITAPHARHIRPDLLRSTPASLGRVVLPHMLPGHDSFGIWFEQLDFPQHHDVALFSKATSSSQTDHDVPPTNHKPVHKLCTKRFILNGIDSLLAGPDYVSTGLLICCSSHRRTLASVSVTLTAAQRWPIGCDDVLVLRRPRRVSSARRVAEGH